MAGCNVLCRLYKFKTVEELEKMGMVRAGWLFEDGCYPSVSGVDYAFAINANSVQKQGAWEFIRYMMSEEVQKALDLEGVTNRAAHMEEVESELERLNTVEGAQGGGNKSTVILSNGQTIEEFDTVYTKEDMTDERIAEYLAAWEDAREITTMHYMRVRPILLIIEEEAEYYFEGVKSLEETIDVINNRVGLYIGEHQ